jgi:hypothetical protein
MRRKFHIILIIASTSSASTFRFSFFFLFFIVIGKIAEIKTALGGVEALVHDLMTAGPLISVIRILPKH